MVGIGNHEAVAFGGGESRRGIRVGVSAAVVLRGCDCKAALQGLLDVFALMRLPASLWVVEDVSYERLVLET